MVVTYQEIVNWHCCRSELTMKILLWYYWHFLYSILKNRFRYFLTHLGA